MTVPVIHSAGEHAAKRLEGIQIEKRDVVKRLADLLEEEKQLIGHMLLQEAMSADVPAVR